MGSKRTSKGVFPGLSRLALIALTVSAAFILPAAIAAVPGPNEPARITADTATGQQRFEGFVKIRGNRKIYVDFLLPQPGKPSVALWNGLTYETDSWDPFVEQLKGQGLGILRWDAAGQGRTLANDGLPSAGYDYREQVTDFESLLTAFGIKRIHIVGLSYGGGLELQFAIDHPDRVESLIAMAPFTEPMKSQDDLIRARIAATRIAFPMNRYSDDALYDWYLKGLVFSTYPMVEPVVLEHPWKLEATYRLAQGIRHFRAADIAARLPRGRLHLVIARQDQYIPVAVLDRFWDAVPESARGSRLYITGSEHKIAEAAPMLAANWVKLIVSGDSRIRGGKTWQSAVWSSTFTRDSDKVSINIAAAAKSAATPRKGSCEWVWSN